ncbi:hypothetical protein NOF55_06350 [Rhizobiaceae bacterium BDR2-2]|uniref:Uncharacterized protein n=1 Tax=Ectorhizobium quercum TaxID=2965071 RepID=A0AAE3N0R6_9HYPH|nr:hypothetical protein [Ectorhizobium quercum]MCX8996722.1 hypothetical protein [Ectorhizobium quercum]
MIEYALLFALGFLTAALLAVAIAPAIHRRIVAYTERRIYATMPISPEEVRAQKDMERAVYAAEAARIGHDLRQERDARLAAARQAEDMAAEAARLKAETDDLKLHIEEMNTAAADMRTENRRLGMHNADLKAALDLSQTTIDTLRKEIGLHEERARRLETDISGLRLDVAARQAENENLAARVQALRNERDLLRNDYLQSTSSLSDLERRSGQSEDRLARLEQKTLQQAADLADMETRLERRQREVEQLRERLRDLLRQNESLKLSLSLAGADEQVPDQAGPPVDEVDDEMPRENREVERLEKRSKALMERIRAAETDRDDDALREELADLAAAMTAYAGGRGQNAERIREILIASPPVRDGGRISLAARIKTAMAEREIGKE